MVRECIQLFRLAWNVVGEALDGCTDDSLVVAQARNLAVRYCIYALAACAALVDRLLPRQNISLS